MKHDIIGTRFVGNPGTHDAAAPDVFESLRALGPSGSTLDA